MFLLSFIWLASLLLEIFCPRGRGRGSILSQSFPLLRALLPIILVPASPGAEWAKRKRDGFREKEKRKIVFTDGVPFSLASFPRFPFTSSLAATHFPIFDAC